MTDNIFEFAKTNQALGNLSETVIRLDAALKSKKQQISSSRQEQKALLEKRESQLENLRTASADVIENIDALINSLDNVLENDGSGNNHN